jgi:hypothetical protein
MRSRYDFFLVLGLLLAGCSTTHGPAKPDVAYTPAPPEAYTRIENPDSNTLQLQIAIRKFIPVSGRGPVIWLAGTTHIGEPAYYSALQQRLDATTVVLFEGVNADAHPRKFGKPGTSTPLRSAPAARAAEGSEEGYSMQSALAKSLGLVFQLDAIDYDRSNFYNSDLSVFQIQQLMLNATNSEPAQPGEPGRSDPTMDSLLQIMDGSSLMGLLVKTGIQFISSSPQLQATAKFSLIETIGRLKGDLATMRGIPPELQRLLKILIESRNQAVIEDLKAGIKQLPASGSIAVFYGTGHMDDMETRVVKQLNYRPDGSLWLPAFSVDLRKTGMSPAQQQWMRGIIQLQLNQMQ